MLVRARAAPGTPGQVTGYAVALAGTRAATGDGRGSAARSSPPTRAAQNVSVGEMRPVQLVVCGSVAVNRAGARPGKGAGYSDIEVTLLAVAGLIGPGTVIVTTVHPSQVIDGPLPETGHDLRVDLIITPGEVIEAARSDVPPAWTGST